MRKYVVRDSEPRVSVMLNVPVGLHNHIMHDVASGKVKNKTHAVLSILEAHYNTSAMGDGTFVTKKELVAFLDDFHNILNQAFALIGVLGDLDYKPIRDVRSAIRALIESEGGTVGPKSCVAPLENLNTLSGRITSLNKEIKFLINKANEIEIVHKLRDE